jgi:hypothetical protein
MRVVQMKLQSAPSHTQSGDFEGILEDEKRVGGHARCAHGGGVSTFKPLLCEGTRLLCVVVPWSLLFIEDSEPSGAIEKDHFNRLCPIANVHLVQHTKVSDLRGDKQSIGQVKR